jgi:hypothetical protein
MDDVFRLTLIEKLHPTAIRYGRDGKMVALVGCILGQDWTMPRMEQITVTSDGFVLGVVGGLANHFVGAFSELASNWTRLCEFAKLTVEEKRVAGEMFRRATGRSCEADEEARV